MKNFLIAIILLLTVSSCLPDKIKKNDPEPDLAGTYQVSRFVSGNQTFNLPANGASASIVVNRRGSDQIDVRLNVTEDGTTDYSDFPTFTLRKASGRDYDILNSNTRIGSVNGIDFVLDFIGNTGQRFAITARK